MTGKASNIIMYILIALVIIFGGAFVFLTFGQTFFKKQTASVISNNNIEVSLNSADAIIEPTPLSLPEKLSNPPEIIKAIYVTGYSAGSSKYLNYLSNIFDKTEINAVVVDIKLSDGSVSYSANVGEVKKHDLDYDVIPDIDELVRFFHDKNVYVIGRIVVFEDTVFAKSHPSFAVYNKKLTSDLESPVLWQDNNNLSWLDPSSRDVWDYNVALAKDVFYHGFDEVNFDYIRFPTDGDTNQIGFPVWDGKTSKADVIKGFWDYLRTNLKGERISADVFGQTTVDRGDMGIGQQIENAFDSFDFVSPMVYPSHYADGFIGFESPAEHPYEVVKYCMDTALQRKSEYFSNEREGDITNTVQAKFRPWIQAFSLGTVYTSEMIKQEIEAVKDSLGSDYVGFMLWNASNIYNQEAVLKPITQ